ncbi:MAG: c-type cytochrome [Deltaproteobacteria bacterium]
MKIKQLIIALAMGASLVVSQKPAPAVEQESSPLLPGNPLEGSRLFTGKGCLRCHSIYGVGGATGPDLGQGNLKRPLLDIAGIMWNHSPGMAHIFQEQGTARPQFKPAEMASLLSFLYYLGSLGPPGDPLAGARLFSEKRCVTCHSLGGKGGTRAPKLDSYGRYASPIYLTANLWNHGQRMAGLMEALRVPRPTLEKNDIADLLAYFRAAAGSVERIYIQPGNPQNGKKLFAEKRCIQCHSVGDSEANQTAPNLRVHLSGSLVRIAGAMWNDGPRMWSKMAERGIPVPTISTEEMSDLISYLYFLQFVDSPGDARRGRVVYEEKRCTKCHSLPGAGGTAGPDLIKAAKTKTPLEVVTDMWNHATTMEQKMLEENLQWPVFKGGEMADLITYLTAAPTAPTRAGGEKAAGGAK